MKTFPSSMVATRNCENEPRRHDERQSFEEVARREFPRLLHSAMRFLQNTQSAEDIVQEALLRAWQNRIPGSHTDFIAAHLQGEVVALCRRERRNRARPIQLLGELDGEETPAPWAQVEQTVVQEEESPYALVVTQLPPTYRDVLEMRFIAGKSSREIADTLGVSQRSTRRMVKDAVVCLKGRIHDVRVMEEWLSSEVPQTSLRQSESTR